jgi:hypothetical protein
LALDFPNGGEPHAELFDRLNAIVKEAGGRLYSGQGRLHAARDVCSAAIRGWASSCATAIRVIVFGDVASPAGA